MQNDIKAIIWDMGGVLLQEKDPEPRRKLAEEYQIRLGDLYSLVFDSEPSNKATVGEIPEKALWDFVQLSLNIPPEKFEDFYARFWSGDQIDAELRSFISNLKEQYQIALLSNAWSGTRFALDEYYDCLGLFDEVVISAEVKMAKPDPAIYNETLRRLAIAPEQSVFVDDRPENIEIANQLGIHGVLFSNSRQAIEDVQNHLKQR